MPYVLPSHVTSPKDRLTQIIEVIHDAGASDWSVAIVEYDGDRCVAIRWNGTEEEPLGYPSVRNYPVWFIVPHFFASTIEHMARQKAEGHDVALPMSTEQLGRQLKSKGYRVTLEL